MYVGLGRAKKSAEFLVSGLLVCGLAVRVWRSPTSDSGDFNRASGQVVP